MHGVRTVEVPWAEPGCAFTAWFEALVIDWLKETSISAVARRVHLSWNAIDGIMQRAVRRGLARRPPQALRHIGIDETAFRKRHDYVTVISTRHSEVVYIAEDRKKLGVEAFYARLTEAQKAAIEILSMPM